jgi:agmatine deiminase
MIIDSQTNFVYLADTLPKKYPKFYNQFERILNRCNINFSILPQTKDVWAVDYMPIQVNEKKFLRFTYNPSYLRSKKYLKTISDVDTICNKLGIETIKSNIVLDGGNVTKTTDKVVMTDRIFEDNPTILPKILIKQLENYFEIDKLFLVPEQPKDFTGHSDGMLRFIDKNTVIINDYSIEKPAFQRAFKIAIHNAGLDYIEIPYNPISNISYNQANGDYINYLQMKDVIIIPTYGLKEDEVVVKQFEQIFKGKNIATINSNDVANDGGVLNCITWNIKI